MNGQHGKRCLVVAVTGVTVGHLQELVGLPVTCDDWSTRALMERGRYFPEVIWRGVGWSIREAMACRDCGEPITWVPDCMLRRLPDPDDLERDDAADEAWSEAGERPARRVEDRPREVVDALWGEPQAQNGAARGRIAALLARSADSSYPPCLFSGRRLKSPIFG